MAIVRLERASSSTGSRLHGQRGRGEGGLDLARLDAGRLEGLLGPDRPRGRLDEQVELLVDLGLGHQLAPVDHGQVEAVVAHGRLGLGRGGRLPRPDADAGGHPGR